MTVLASVGLCAICGDPVYGYASWTKNPEKYQDAQPLHEGDCWQRYFSEGITASDLLHLPHIVIRYDGDILGFTEFATGAPAHEYAMRKMSETPGQEVIVCVRIRTLKYLAALDVAEIGR